MLSHWCYATFRSSCFPDARMWKLHKFQECVFEGKTKFEIFTCCNVKGPHVHYNFLLLSNFRAWRLCRTKISVWGMWLSVFFTSKDRRYFTFLFTTTFAFTNLNIVLLNILVIDCKMCTMGPSDWNNVRNFENRGHVALRKCNCIRKAGSWVILRILL